MPGAVFVDLDTELAAPPGPGGRHPLPGSGRAAGRAAPRRGVAPVPRWSPTTTATARSQHGRGGCCAGPGLPADRVAVLDGGFRAWVADGRPTTAAPTRPAPGDVVVRPGAMPVLDADGAAELARSGVLLDARAGRATAARPSRSTRRPGHVPGARNLPATEHRRTRTAGRWRAAELAEQFAAARAPTGATPVGAYCGSGVNATALVLAAEYAGLRPPDAPLALYAGSWSQWSSDPRRPVATGRRSVRRSPRFP